jgi:hypothetical protein
MDKIVYKFTLDESQIQKIKHWEENLLPKRLKKQKFVQWYMFQHSGIGLIVVVKRDYDNQESRDLDITDYSTW